MGVCDKGVAGGSCSPNGGETWEEQEGRWLRDLQLEVDIFSVHPSKEAEGYFEAGDYLEVRGEPCSLEADFSTSAELTVILVSLVVLRHEILL